MNSDCDHNIKSSSRKNQSEFCTKLNYVYTSRQCDEYLNYLEELRDIIFGTEKRNMSPGLPSRETHSIHYHTTNGKTLTYRLENVANYGISLSPLSSETETVIAESVLSEPHVAPTVERTIPLQLSHLPSEIEERMLCCLHSSKEYLSKDINDRDYYVPTSTTRHENLRTVYPNGSCYPNNVSGDTVVPHNKNREISKNKNGNSTNEGLEQEYLEDVFAYGDTEGMGEFVDEEFAVMEEFATVLEESESVFEEVEDYTEELEDYIVRDEDVLRVIDQEHLLESVSIHLTETVQPPSQELSESSTGTSIDCFEDRSLEEAVEVGTVEQIALESEHADTAEGTSEFEHPADQDDIKYEMEDDEPAEEGVYFEESDDDPEMQEVTYLKFDDDGLTDFPMFGRTQPSENYNSNSYLESLEEEDEEVEEEEEEEEEEEDEGVGETSSFELSFHLKPTKETGNVEESDTVELRSIDFEPEELETPKSELEPACWTPEDHAVSSEGSSEEERSPSPEAAHMNSQNLTDDKLLSQSTTDGLPESALCERVEIVEEHGNYGLLQDQFEESLSVFDKLTSAILQSENVLNDDVEPGTDVCELEDDRAGHSGDHPFSDQFPQESTSSSQSSVVTPADTELIDLVRNYVNLVINAPKEIIYPNTLEEDLEDETHGEPSCRNHVNEEELPTDKEENATSLTTFFDTEEVDVNESENKSGEKLRSKEDECFELEPVSAEPVLEKVEVVVIDDEPISSEHWFDENAGEAYVRSIVDEVLSHALESVEELLFEPGTSSEHTEAQNNLPVSVDESDSSDDSEESFITVIFNPFSTEDIAETTVPSSVKIEMCSEETGEQFMTRAPNELEMETDDLREQNEHSSFHNIEQHSNASPDSEEDVSAELEREEESDEVRESTETRKHTMPSSIDLEESDNQYTENHENSEKRDIETTEDSLQYRTPTRSTCTLQPWSSITVKRASREGSPDLHSEETTPSENNCDITSDLNVGSEREILLPQTIPPALNEYEEPVTASTSLDLSLSNPTSIENCLEKEMEDVAAELETGFTLDYHVLAFYVHEGLVDELPELSTAENLGRCDDRTEDIVEMDSDNENSFVTDASNNDINRLIPEQRTASCYYEEVMGKPVPDTSDFVTPEDEEETIGVTTEYVEKEEYADYAEDTFVPHKKTPASPTGNSQLDYTAGSDVFDESQHLEEETWSPTTTALNFAQESVVVEGVEDPVVLGDVSDLQLESADMKDSSADDDDVFQVLHFVISNVEFCGIGDQQFSIHTSSPFEKREHEVDEKKLHDLEADKQNSQHVNPDALFEHPVTAEKDDVQEMDNNNPSTFSAQDELATDSLVLESLLEPSTATVPTSCKEIFPDKKAELQVESISIEAFASELVKQVLENVVYSLTLENAGLCVPLKETQVEAAESSLYNHQFESCVHVDNPDQFSIMQHEACFDLEQLEVFALSLADQIIQEVLETGKPEEYEDFADYDDHPCELRNEVTDSFDPVSEVMELPIANSTIIETECMDQNKAFGVSPIDKDAVFYQDCQHNSIDDWLHNLSISITSGAAKCAANSSTFAVVLELNYHEAPETSCAIVEHEDEEEENQSSPFSSQETTHDCQTRDANEKFGVIESVFYQETLEIFNHIDCTIPAAKEENTSEKHIESVLDSTDLSSSDSPAVNKHCALEMYSSSTSTLPMKEVLEHVMGDSEGEAEDSETFDVKDSNNYNSSCSVTDGEQDLTEENQVNPMPEKLQVSDKTEEDEFEADSELSALLERSQLISTILDINRNHQTEEPQERSFDDDCKSPPATWKEPLSLSTSAPDQPAETSDDDDNAEDQDFRADQDLNAVLETSALISSILEYSHDVMHQPPLETMGVHDQLTPSSSFLSTNPEGPLSPSFITAPQNAHLENSEVSSLVSEMITSLERNEIALSEDNAESVQTSAENHVIPVASELSVVKEEHRKTDEVSTTAPDRTVGEIKKKIPETTIPVAENVNNGDLSHDVTNRAVDVNSEDVSGFLKKDQQEFDGNGTDVVELKKQHEETVAAGCPDLENEDSATPAQPAIPIRDAVDLLNSVPVSDRSFDVVSDNCDQSLEEHSFGVVNPSFNVVHVLKTLPNMEDELEPTYEMGAVSRTPILPTGICNVSESQDHREENEQDFIFSSAPEEHAVVDILELSHTGSTSLEAVLPVLLSSSLEEPSVTSNLQSPFENPDHPSCFDTPETTLQPAVETRFTPLPEDFKSSCSTSAMTKTLENQSILLPPYQFPPCKQELEDLVDQDPHVSHVPISRVSTSSEPLSTVSDAVPENSSLKDPSSTESSFKHPEPLETSSVVEEVSYLLTTVCVAALAFVPSSESPSTPFNSDIIEDVSKYFSTDPKPEPDCVSEKDPAPESENMDEQI